MNNSNDRNEAETIKLKKVSIEKNPIKKNYQLCLLILIIVLISCIFIFLLSFDNHCYLSQSKEKEKKEENIIENKKMQLNNVNFNSINEGKKITSIEREFLYDINFYMLNEMHGSKDNKGNGNSYNILFNTHSLEKGFSHFDLRPFGKKTIKKIIDLLKKQLGIQNYERLFSFINGINSLREYKKTYEKHKWTDKQEYKEVSEFLKSYEKIIDQKTGAFVMTKEELKKDYDIDYNKFIKSRHSTRNYKNITLKIEDIKKAINMAKYSASACNRQYIKVHYYPKGKMRQNIIDYSLGKGGLYLEGVNTFILTFDTNGLSGAGERNQGYFNAGLFSTNFVNALHSLGIGTCFIQFANSVKEEEKLKELNKIPSSERIAVILYAGYYDDKSIFCVSPRKDFEEYFTLHE